nr:MAG TPA: nuclease [Caudoviricetes sp.]
MANRTVEMPVVNTKKQQQGDAVEMPVVNTKRQTVTAQQGSISMPVVNTRRQRTAADTVKANTAQDGNQNFLSRAWKTITGGLKGSAAGNMDAMGVAYQAGQGGRTQQNAQGLKDAQWALARAKRAYDQEQSVATAAELNNAMTAMRAYSTVLGSGAYDQALKAAYNVASQLDTGDMNALYESLGKVQVDPNTGVQQKATEAARDLAAQVQQSGARDIERAKTGLGTFGQMVVDVGASMAQMGGDFATNALLGTTGSMIPFATRAFGGGTMQARSEGADFGQQIAYGGALAGKEVLTEKMFNIALPFAKAYGGGALDDVTQKAIQTAVDKLGRTPAGKRALNAALQLTASGVSEGMEELIGDWMEWQMPRIYGGDVDTASETLANSLYDFVVGGMSGVAGSAITPGTYQYGNEAATVQENTAPEMNEKAAEAVEALRQGKNITGNQAAAIAKDPIAVAALEQATGVQLDTEKPISELKRDIAALSGRESVQERVEMPAYTPRTQKRTQSATGGFMESGQQAYNALRQENSSAEAYAGFSGMYNAGLNGVDADQVNSRFAQYLTPEQRYAAYNAGLQDAATATARENAEVKRVTVDAGAGLVNNEWYRNLIRNNKGTAKTLNEMGKKLGVRIEFVESVMDGKANGQYLKESNTIQIALDADNPIMEVAAHEITHRMQDLAPEEYRAFRQAAIEYRMRENGADTETEVVQRYMEAAERAGVTLTQDEVMDEIVADFAGRMIEDTDLFAQFAKDNRTAAQKLLDGLKEFIAKVKAMFTGKARDNATMDAYGKTFVELEDIAQKWQAAFDAAERQAERAKTAAGEGDGAKYQIKQFPNGMKYVQADRQVLFGNDPKAWSEQLENYINGKIRNHEDVRLIAEDGDVLLLTSKSAGKLSSIYDNNGRTMDEKAFERKANAAAHIDELIKVSERGGKTVLDFGGRHGDMAKDGWNYRTAYFMDFDGKYYRTRISVALGKDGSIVYNIGEMQERSTPQINGSSGNSGAQRGNASGISILTDGENVKPKFLLKAPVEETKNLLALHNLTEKNLLDAAKIGGLPMPSIAIVKADEGHGEYGDISFVFSKDTIDPQLFRSNKVYGYDAWTPTAPRIEYEVNEKSAKKIHDLFYRMERAKGRSFADPLYSAANTLEDELNRKGGVDKVVGAMRDDPRVMNIYLEDTGRGAVENVMKREVTRMDDNQQEMASFLIRELGESTVNDFRAKGGESPVAARKLWYKEHGEALNAALQKYYEKLGLPAKDAADVVNAETVAAKMRYMLDTRKYLAGNTETVTEEVDRDATNKAIRDKVNQKEYEQWLDDLFDGVVKNEGIYNGKDYYTSSGNRRSFSATHYEITLENIVKAMKQGDQKGANTFFGGQAIWGVASKDYGSIDEIKADSGRLQKMTEEEYSAIRQKYSERLAELTNEIKDPAARNEFIASDDAASAIVETLRTKRTVAGIDKELRTYPTLQIKPDTAEKVLQLYEDISNMPTGYFEAKPQRAVGFDEVLAAVIPNDASAEVKAALENAGVRMIEYTSGDEKARLDAVNSVEGARFQLRSTADIEQEVRDLKRERTVLASRNRALEQRVQELKGEMRISKEPSVVLRDVKKLGRETIRKYGSDVKYGDIQADMEALGKAVMKKDVSMADLMPYARNAATAIVDNTTELTEHGAELLEIKDYLKRQKILFNGEMDHYNEFRNRYMGTLKLNKSEGLPVDTMYEEMTEMFGEGYFPSDVYTEADKLQQIADVLDSMDSIYENPFDSYRDAAIQEIANDIIDGMISDQVRQKKTFADRRELEKQEAVGRVREMLTKEREKRRDMVKRMRREYSEKTQKGREKRYAAEMRAKIARHTGPLSEKLLRPTDKKHIPEELRVVVADLLRNINLESAYSYDENGRLRKNAGGDPTRRTQEAVKLKKAYEDIIAREANMVVDPDLLDSGGLLDSLAALGGKRIADMNVTELETVWNAVRAIEATLTSYDRTLANQKYARTSEWADSLMMGSMSRKRRNRKISLDMADPYTFFSAYGDGGMQVYRTLRNAQDREHVMLTELREAAKKFLDADVYKNRFERHTFTTSRGVELTLTNEQIMHLYNLAKRGEQAMNHLMVGGIVQPEIKRDGKLKAIPRGTENILLTLEDVRAITSVLTPEQIKVADGLQKLASTKLAEWGNEASMAVYGYRKFMEAHYWPIKTAKEATASSVEKGPDIAREIKNMGSAKALTPNASNALDIGGVYDVFAQNASDMIKYATLLAPMEDINRLYNYRYRDSMGNLTGKNVRQVLSGVYGDAAQSYWRNLMRDVQNGMVKNASATTRAVERIVGNTKGAAVGANLRVVIQQPTAYFRAAVVLDPENMAKGLGNGVTKGNGWDKARKWAPIAGIKDTSGFDQGSRYTIAREVYGTDGGFMERLNDKSMSLAGKADAITWGKIWNACEWQVAADMNLEVGSDAYYQQVAEVFTDVIDQTQVVDGIMQRTQIMRDSDALTRQATSFMGEPLKSLNILMRSYDAWVYETNPQKRSKALKQLKRAVGALLVTDVVNALAQSIVDGLRDDDKDKKYWERVLEAFTGITGEEKDFGEAVKNITLQGNVKGNITLVGRIPYAKDIISILQGYTVDRMDAGAVDDIVRATKSMIASANGSGKKTAAYNAKQLITMVSKIFGVSVANLGRDTWAIARSIASETGNVRLMFEMEKAIYRMDKSAGNRKTWCELLYRAQKDRDTETARLIYREMLAHGYEETDVRQGVEAIMKQEQGVNSVKELRNRWMAP